MDDNKTNFPLTGTGMRLDLVVIFDSGSRWVYEIKSLASCPSNYGSRWKNKAKAWSVGSRRLARGR